MIVDVNDNPPTFANPEISVNISEVRLPRRFTLVPTHITQRPACALRMALSTTRQLDSEKFFPHAYTQNTNCQFGHKSTCVCLVYCRVHARFWFKPRPQLIPFDTPTPIHCACGMQGKTHKIRHRHILGCLWKELTQTLATQHGKIYLLFPTFV